MLKKSLLIFSLLFMLTSCVSKKKYTELMNLYDTTKKDFTKCSDELNDCFTRVDALTSDLKSCLNEKTSTEARKDEQIMDLKSQVQDLKELRDKQAEQVGNLTVLSQSANENIRETLSQLEKKDKYISKIQEAKSKADSINLVLAVNLKSALSDGIYDQDIEVSIDKTVVMINLSDKMLFSSGSTNLTTKAKEVLAKIARIIETRPDVEVLIEGHTDSKPISRNCLKDNWDLSVSRSVAITRVLQDDYNIDPSKLIPSGRSQYLPIASNETPEGRSLNRRTRILIMPKLDQFYELLEPQDNY